MNQTLLTIDNLDVTFQAKFKPPFHAIKNLSLELQKGETFALVGESGSGKSVTSLAIMGLLPPTANINHGRIVFNGQDLTKYSNDDMRKIRGHCLAMIFQEPMTSLNPLIPAGKQVMEPMRIHLKISKEEAKKKAFHLLERVGLSPASLYFGKYPHELSGGQQQRIMIAMAISCEPSLLIADEPTTALDVTIQKQVLNLLLELQAEMKMTLLFITHDLAIVGDIADRIAVMRHGQIVETAPSSEIFSKPNHSYTKGLIACRPPLHTRPRRLATIQDFMDENGEAKTPRPELFQDAPRHRIAIEQRPILEIQGVSKIFEKRSLIPGLGKNQAFKAVDDVSFDIPEGVNFGLVGESGCGKTTLARMMIRLMDPSCGAIRFRGQDIAKLDEKAMKPIRRKIQYIFQNPYAALNPRFTIEQILMEPMAIHNVGSDRQERVERMDHLLNQVGLEPQSKAKYPHEFSGGQRQRICIARALIVEPELVICDESVAALDVSIQAQILNLLLDLQDEYGVTYIFISHDLSVVRFFADQVAVMKAGKIVEIADSDSIYLRPQHAFTHQLLSSIPKGIPKPATDIYQSSAKSGLS